MSKKQFSYTQSVAEIESILEEVEGSETIEIDEVLVKIRKASNLLKQCKAKLLTTEKEVQELMEEIDKD